MRQRLKIRQAKKKAPSKRKLTSEQQERQRIYAARNAAKAKGLPLPPLPSAA